MNIDNLNTIDDLHQFIIGNQAVAFRVLGNKSERYQFVQSTLIKFGYITRPKKDKGVILKFLRKATGYSRQQLVRLASQHKQYGQLRWVPCRSNGFSRQYTAQDIKLLAEMDERHQSPSGHALKKLCERSYVLYGEEQYRNLASISVSHLYNLRASKDYLKLRRTFEKTKPRQVAIGERRKPNPNGQPGYIRIDTVHQGDLDKQKGVYHINAVDEVTQFEIVCSVEKISEHFLIPALEQILESFPFKISGFHSDNGSEYINRQVAELLQKLFIEFTKSRSRQSNDNALAESKNASVVRKQFGYLHIPQKWAPKINEFNKQYLNSYVNYHRPCFFPEIKIDDKGRQRKVYKYENMMTPYEKLKSLPNAESYLKEGITFEILDAIAMEMSDNEAAEALLNARKRLFNQIFEQSKKRA